MIEPVYVPCGWYAVIQTGPTVGELISETPFVWCSMPEQVKDTTWTARFGGAAPLPTWRKLLR